MRLQDYEPGKDVGKDWYVWRIIHLVDEVNRLTDLLSIYEAPAVTSPFRTYGEIMEAQREKRGLAEQAAADHARDALINETIVSG